MLGLSGNLSEAVFVYLYLCIWVSEIWDYHSSGPCTEGFPKIYYMYGLWNKMILSKNVERGGLCL